MGPVEYNASMRSQYSGNVKISNEGLEAAERTPPIRLSVDANQVCEPPLHRPWYRQKQWPSFRDMLTTLRRLTFEEKLAGCRGNRLAENSVIRQLTYFLSLAG